MTIVSNDLTWCHKLECLSRVINYALRVVTYSPREQCWTHLQLSLTVIIYDRKTFILQATGLLETRYLLVCAKDLNDRITNRSSVSLCLDWIEYIDIYEILITQFL
jgi:hypothetical protein